MPPPARPTAYPTHLMPFTAAHPAAVIPLRRLLGRHGDLSALVIGSMAPDFVYYLPLGLERSASHSARGLPLVVLPLGLAAYALFCGLMRRPLLDLLPPSVSARFEARAPEHTSSEPHNALHVALCIVLGGATHLLWDACTHRGGFVLQHFAPLAESLWVVGGYDIEGYKLLQHGSTFFGLTLLAFWARAWLRRCDDPAHATPPPESRFHARRRRIVMLLVATAALCAGLAAGLAAPDRDGWLQHLQYFAGPALRAGISAAILTLLAYCLLWHATGRRAHQA